MWRVGIGYDSHGFADNRPLVLGGVTIPHPQGLQGHSDADALIHAIGDAVLGAVGAADLGHQFPDSDPAYRGISSLILLEKIKGIAEERGFQITYIDTVIVMEKPKIAAYINEMKRNIAQVLGIEEERISIKAKTNEEMGFIGRGEGMAALAVVTVTSSLG